MQTQVAALGDALREAKAKEVDLSQIVAKEKSRADQAIKAALVDQTRAEQSEAARIAAEALRGESDRLHQRAEAAVSALRADLHREENEVQRLRAAEAVLLDEVDGLRRAVSRASGALLGTAGTPPCDRATPHSTPRGPQGRMRCARPAPGASPKLPSGVVLTPDQRREAVATAREALTKSAGTAHGGRRALIDRHAARSPAWVTASAVEPTGQSAYSQMRPLSAVLMDSNRGDGHARAPSPAASTVARPDVR